jgi:hypothetical protein
MTLVESAVFVAWIQKEILHASAGFEYVNDKSPLESRVIAELNSE